MTVNKKRLSFILMGIGGILLIPLVAMQFTTEVNWTFADFLIGGGLLTALGLGFEMTIRLFKQRNYRILFFSIILILFSLIWLELAVGLFGTPFAGN